MDRVGVLILVVLSAAVLACNNVVTIYDYSSSGKTHVDTVYVERPGAPVPPDTSGSEGAGIEHPGRWSSWQVLSPGTARVQTICAPIDSMTIYRMEGNVLNGRGGLSARAIELDVETRRAYDGDVEYSLILVFQSHTSWQDGQGSGDLLTISSGQSTLVSYGSEAIEDLVVEPQTTMTYTVRAWLPITLEQMRGIQSQDRVVATFFQDGESQQHEFSEDNLVNFRTFMEVFMIGDGTKSDDGDVLSPGRESGVSRN